MSNYQNSVLGTDGDNACVSAYVVCNNIFNSIMKIAGDVNVRKHKIIA